MNDTSKAKGEIRQHYVPQFYLRNFGEKLYCFDKKEGKQFCSKPKNLAVRKNFYGKNIDGLPSLESEFGKLESRYSVSIKKMIENKDYYSLGHNDKLQICEFLGFQYLRTEQQRKDIKSTTDAILGAVFESVIPPKLKLTHGGATDLGIQLSLFEKIECFAKLFFNMKFTILRNNTAIPYWASDNPLARQNEHDQASFGTLGIANSGIEFHLPLTSRLSLLVRDPMVFDSAPDQIQDIKRGVIRENFLQFASSVRFVYSSLKRFHLIKCMLDNYPLYRDENRERFRDFWVTQDDGTKILIHAERNFRWPISPDRPVLDKMRTWVPKKFMNEIMDDVSKSAT